MATSQPGLLSTGSPYVTDFIATSPFEISALVLSHLGNCDLKALRLTCNKLANHVRPHLRFKRVFISASPLDVRVFRAIAEDDTFHRDVREIIWNDARYETTPPPDTRLRHLHEDLCDSDDEDDRDGEDDRPEKPPHGKDYDAETLPQHLETAKQLETQLPLDVVYAHYQELLAEQNKVLSTSADVAALNELWRTIGSQT
ncbi:hypothetical protein COL516b_003112 [Colletotrichum fioriniae]|nr:uncharacterized protein COL516b_003112 [Colletotrichum fioriniae]KAJ0309214.1 hypothetical protein COL516b_003112 [Colletotrichum fioriniae]